MNHYGFKCTRISFIFSSNTSSNTRWFLVINVNPSMRSYRSVHLYWILIKVELTLPIRPYRLNWFCIFFVFYSRRLLTSSGSSGFFEMTCSSLSLSYQPKCSSNRKKLSIDQGSQNWSSTVATSIFHNIYLFLRVPSLTMNIKKKTHLFHWRMTFNYFLY